MFHKVIAVREVAEVEIQAVVKVEVIVVVVKAKTLILEATKATLVITSIR